MGPPGGAPRPGRPGVRPLLAAVPARPSASRALWLWYGIGAAVLIALFPVLPATGRRVDYALVSASAIPALVIGAFRIRGARRTPWWLLVGSVSLANLADIVRLVPSEPALTTSRFVDAAANLLALAAALGLVARQGRQDIGGIIDSTIVALAVGGLLWISVLKPNQLPEFQQGPARLGQFIAVFALTGVLGALVRLVQVATWAVTALWALIVALVLTLIGNIALTLSADALVQILAPVMFMMAYTALGLFGLDPTAHRLAHPGPRPREDALSVGRLVFLGAAVAVIPLVVGVRAFLGAGMDALVLVGGGLFVTTLVMVRIGVLSAERTRAESTLRFEASHDSLTGLANRRAFIRQLRRALAHDAECVIIFCDLNGFKRVNDRLGHAAGDQLLVEVARRLRACVREKDLVSRFGGDEFLILFPDSRLADIEGVRDRIVDAMARPVVLRGEAVTIGASIGVATASENIGPEELIRRADESMYSAKRPEEPDGPAGQS